MSTKSDMISAIQYAANNTGDAAIKLSLGTPGSKVSIEGQEFDTGKAWVPAPMVFEILIEGIADYLNESGTAQMKGKLNEVIDSLNQIISDYNSGTHPTSANSVSKLT